MQLAGFSPSLWLCRKRAICPRNSAVCNTSPNELAVSNSSRCNLVGILFHRMMTAAPRQRKTCSSIAAIVLLSTCFSATLFCRSDVVRADDLVEIVRQPVFVICEQTEAVLRSLMFSDLARNDRISEQFGALRRFCPEFVCREHRTCSPRPPNNRCPALALLLIFGRCRAYMGMARSNCEDWRVAPGAGRLWAGVAAAGRIDAANLYFEQTTVCPCV